MKVTPQGLWITLKSIRDQSPLIHNITNYVVMNYTANALLAIGASPVMAHAEEEVGEMVSIARSLVINIGTLSSHWIKSMFKAAQRASERNIPIVLDPVGAGATNLRTQVARDLIEMAHPAVIRGNASEILAILKDDVKTKGVDSTASSNDAVRDAQRLSKTYGSVVCISGAEDYIISTDAVIKVSNGHPLMTCVTGMGCTASALCGAFTAVNQSTVLAVAEAMALMGICGEIAVSQSKGPGSFQYAFLDSLYAVSQEQIERLLKSEVLS